MSFIDAMLEQLAAARGTLADGEEIVPSWLITTPEGSYLIPTDFNSDNPEQRKLLRPTHRLGLCDGA